MNAFIGELDTRCVRDEKRGIFQLLAPFSYRSDIAGCTITAPVGFRTDLMSIPRLPGIFDWLGDRARKSGTIHDYAYSSHCVSREMADMILREMVQIDGLSEVEAESVYLAVRMFGAEHW